MYWQVHSACDFAFMDRVAVLMINSKVSIIDYIRISRLSALSSVIHQCSTPLQSALPSFIIILSHQAHPSLAACARWPTPNHGATSGAVAADDARRGARRAAGRHLLELDQCHVSQCTMYACHRANMARRMEQEVAYVVDRSVDVYSVGLVYKQHNRARANRLLLGGLR